MDINERFERQESSLDAVVEDVRALRGEVGELRTEVGGLRIEVGELRSEVGGLRGEVGDLRSDVGALRGEVRDQRDGLNELRLRMDVLHEETSSKIQLIAEVQSRHGEAIDELRRDVAVLREVTAPLPEMYQLLRRVVVDHETRLHALENRPS